MFSLRYFNPRYWAERYFPKVGADAPQQEGDPDVAFTSSPRQALFTAQDREPAFTASARSATFGSSLRGTAFTSASRHSTFKAEPR